MTQFQSQPNHVVNPLTGFLENPAYIYDFDSEKKLAFLSIYKQNGLKLYRTCAEVGVKADTVNKHYALDPKFKSEMDLVKREYYDELEGVSRVNCLNPRSVIERIFRLKSHFPEKYGDGKRESAVNISINLDGKMLRDVNKREQIVEAEEIKNISFLEGKNENSSMEKKENSNEPESD